MTAAHDTRPADLHARDIPGVLGGSRLLAQPHHAHEVERFRSFTSGGSPVWIEVGFDHGRRLHSMARLNPAWRLVGIEVRKARVEEARERAQREGLTNLLAWRVDARTVFATVLEAGSLAGVEVLFPTPWWDAAKRARRLLVGDAFLDDVARALRPGGILHIATDVARYAAEIEATLKRQSTLAPLAGEDAASLLPACDQLSRREWKCQRESTAVSRFYVQRQEGGR